MKERTSHREVPEHHPARRPRPGTAPSFPLRCISGRFRSPELSERCHLSPAHSPTRPSDGGSSPRSGAFLSKPTVRSLTGLRHQGFRTPGLACHGARTVVERGSLVSWGPVGDPGGGLSLYPWWTGVEDKHLGTERVLTGVACVLLRSVQAPLPSSVSFASHTPLFSVLCLRVCFWGTPTHNAVPKWVPVEKSC